MLDGEPKSKPSSGKGSGRGSGSGSGSGAGYGNGAGDGNGTSPPGAVLYGILGSSATNGDLSVQSANPQPSAPMTPEQAHEAKLKERLHDWLYALVTRLVKGDPKPSPNESMFVCDGKADIQIELTVRSPGVLEKLQAAGFEVTSDKGKSTVFGRVSLDKLGNLADIAEVKLILPKI